MKYTERKHKMPFDKTNVKDIFNKVYNEHKILIDNLANTSQPLSSVDKVVEQIMEANRKNTQHDIPVEAEELKIFTLHKERSFAGIGEYVGENAAMKALHLALNNTELPPSVIKEARKAIIHFTIHPDIAMLEIAESMDIIHETVHTDAEIFWGVTHDELLKQDYVKVMIVLVLHSQDKKDKR